MSVGSPRYLNLPETFNAAVHFVDRNVEEGRGHHTAVEFGSERITYDEVLRRVNQLGNALRSRLDVRPEERVALLLLDCPDFVYCFFGAMKIGAVPIPISTLLKAADYAYMLNDSRASVAFVSAVLVPTLETIPRADLPYLKHIVVVGAEPSMVGRPTFEDLIDGASARLSAESTCKDAAAFWLYSSGSTGFPKGCVHLHHDMVVCAELYAQGVLGIRETDRCFSVAKLFFAYGLGNGLYFPFSVGASTVLWPGPPTAPNVYSVIEGHKPTLFFSVPTNYGMLLVHERQGADFDLTSVRHAASAGEALPAALFERFKQRFGVEILDGIGSTEILHIFISNQPGAVRPGSSGQLVHGYEAQLVDDHNAPVRQGEIGLLLVKGDSICALYWNKHEKTKSTIQGDWIRTGDKYYEDEDGYYWYAGRSDDMLKVGGLWVSPVEVENALIEHPAVLECGVCAKADHDGLTKPMAFVVVREGIPATLHVAEELTQFVRARLADYKRPRWIEFLRELPKTATGKMQRFKLRELAASARQSEVQE